MGIKISDKKLRIHLDAKKSLLGNLEFSFASTNFKLARLASGGGLSGVGGSYPVLETCCPSVSRLIIGHEHSSKYTRGKFLILPAHKIIPIKDLNVLIGCDDQLVMRKLENFLQQNPFVVPLLFNKPFSQITIASRIDVGLWPFFQRNNVLQYTGLPETVYDQPHEFDLYLKSLLLLRHHLFGH